MLAIFTLFLQAKFGYTAAETSTIFGSFLAATDLFAANHFNGVSIKEIAKKSGVNSALISYYFGGKKKSLSGSSQRTVKFIFMKSSVSAI